MTKEEKNIFIREATKCIYCNQPMSYKSERGLENFSSIEESFRDASYMADIIDQEEKKKDKIEAMVNLQWCFGKGTSKGTICSPSCILKNECGKFGMKNESNL